MTVLAQAINAAGKTDVARCLSSGVGSERAEHRDYLQTTNPYRVGLRNCPISVGPQARILFQPVVTKHALVLEMRLCSVDRVTLDNVGTLLDQEPDNLEIHRTNHDPQHSKSE